LAAVGRRVKRAGASARYKLLSVMLGLLGGKRATTAFAEGHFRTGGEVHQWMYDRQSLSALLLASGFADVTLPGPDESAIPGFVGFELDTLNGRVRKPGSLFLEARKPH